MVDSDIVGSDKAKLVLIVSLSLVDDDEEDDDGDDEGALLLVVIVVGLLPVLVRSIVIIFVEDENKGK